ncbi:MAG: O-antigen ligase family protein, partial [Candidatus Omnitrophica bacterium]|nr:O-antigen ligase family protein [Candidatus Omnitrophota bacterium]
MSHRTITSGISNYLGRIFNRFGVDKSCRLEAIGLFLMGLISFGYLLFRREFAECHIQFSFLDFPIFIGEILIFLCLIVLSMKWKKFPPKLKAWHYSLFFYFIFVAAKAFWGYLGPSKWGPLAFRHAALFYYPLFAIFGYTFYKKKFFSQNAILILSLLLIISLRINIVKLFFRIQPFFLFTVFILAFVLIKAYSLRSIKYALFLLLFLLVPYGAFLRDSRAILVGNVTAAIFICVAIIFILKAKARTKVFILGLCMFFLLLAVFKLGYVQEIKSLIDLGKLKKQYLESKELVSDTENDYNPKEIKAVLYNPQIKRKAALPVSVIEEKPVEVNPTAEKNKEPESRLKEIQASTIGVIDSLEKLSPQPVNTDLAQIPKAKKALSSPIATEIQATLGILEEKVVRVNAVLERLRKISEKTESFRETEDVWVLVKKAQNEIEQNLALLNELEIATEDVELTKAIQEFRNKIEDPFLNIRDTRYKLRVRKASDARGNSIFRILIWRDALIQLIKEKPLLGFDFGKPFRSRGIEIAGFAGGEWGRDGWIAFHNSYLAL